MNGKKWSICVLSGALALVLSLGALCGYLNYTVDPYFHYRAPKENQRYILSNERYQNNGILRHFKYQLMITGSSMSSNFRTSESEALFGLKSVKTAFRGGTLKEVNDNVRLALQSNPDLKVVIRPADGSQLSSPKDQMNYALPEYLLDDSVLNDYKYLLNKDTLFQDTLPEVRNTLRGGESTSFDDYGSWMEGRQTGAQEVLRGYERSREVSPPMPLSRERMDRARENILANLAAVPRDYPDQEFYYFFPPYSICYFDNLYRSGDLENEIELYRLASELMLAEDNIHLFAFFEEQDLIADLDNYTDTMHYDADGNSRILTWMAEGSHELTSENYEAYWDSILEAYRSFDYAAVFGEEI